ncbi:hypothetical protein GH714_021828 [Hevea brasiliensis]|uniref:Reverse transcriptase Ty1/copia-type domain-containing protein n=1 Tax=Hevea brasiliensis TaxID=3981 RepID=A0A6A6N621_HEVBR|nr:hypothetical protein GH714_021828 [Hevea brasiliensis]
MGSIAMRRTKLVILKEKIKDVTNQVWNAIDAIGADFDEVNADNRQQPLEGADFDEVNGDYRQQPLENAQPMGESNHQFIQLLNLIMINGLNGRKSELFGFSDSDFAGDPDDRKSTSGFVFMLGSGAVSWSSKKQQIVTLSTTEAEFVAATSCACQAIWLRRILEDLKFKQQGAITIYCDSNSAIKLSKNPVLYGRSKHMDVKFHCLRDLTKDGVIDIVYCRSEEQVADLFTKPLKMASFVKLKKLLGVCTLEDPD